MVLKDEAKLPQEANLRDRLLDVAKAQQRKVENKQWKYQWFGKPQTVRDTIERILNLISQSAGLISIGMTYAPPYVSPPWSVATSLIPLMMNEFNEHKAAIDGLETTVKLIFGYQLAEKAFLVKEETRNVYEEAVFDPYKKILYYQAMAIRFFGRSTLRRLGKNILGSK